MTAFLGLWACREPEPTKPEPEPEPTDTATTTTPTGDTGTLPSGALVLAPENNYAATVTFTLPEVEVRAGNDVLVSWSGISVDAWGSPLGPVAAERLVLLQLLAAKADAPARLAADDLGADLLSTWTADVSGRPFADLSELSAGATAFVPSAYLLENDAHTWIVGLAMADGERLDLRTAAILTPRAAGASTTLPFADGGATFAGSAELDGVPVVTAAASAPFSVDWEAVPHALGHPLDADLVDQLFVARLAGPPAGFADQVTDLPGAAEEAWFLAVRGETTADLALARDAGGGTFPGFAAGEPYVIGLRCTTCLTRYPAVVAAVEVR